ncbi:MAG: VWA domain-containing protein [Planctomycetes bacterium]|nr:VWA domain-containing protein [Planctomycetota bacterium]
MHRTLTKWAVIPAALAAAAFWGAAARAVETEPVGPDALAKQMDAMTKEVTQGALRIVKPGGEVVECPLKHTDVQADVSGFIARVRVTQVFFNPLDEKIEAVYVFPLPHKSAVDDMTMVIGQRRIVGLIKRRAEARQIYEEALAQGATAALLEQERPNIFTQSVGNIAPRQEVRIEISYVDVLEYDMGTYEFHFPMVVGPRYIPGSPTSSIPPVPPELKGKVGELDKGKVREGPGTPQGTGWSPDTTRVPDASRITPPVLKPGFRNGHDISLSVTLNAGVPIQDLKVTSHEAAIQRTGKSEAAVKLAPADSIPNKAFVLRYAVVGQMPEMAMLAHTGARGQGYFMLMVQPADDERLRQSPPREIVFLVDVSGSMSGNPTAKVIDAMQKFLRLCKAEDTVQVITFAGDSRKLFEKPVPVTEENIKEALGFTKGLKGGGGTEMLKGIRMVLAEPPDPKRVRIVIMLTDGYIGNEAEIIAEVGRRAGDRIRFWCIGIGSDPNRFLLDGVARQGGGMSKTLGLKDDPAEMVQEVMFRIHRAQLADVEIDWGGLKVFETYPAKIPELWAGRPIVVFGLYDRGGGTTIRVTGNVEGQPASWPLQVFLPENEQRNDVLAKVWARNKIEDLMQQTFYAGSPEVEEVVTSIALEYRLMSQYTSFVAVDESTIGRLREPARPPRRMLVPVPLPEGTRYEGFFGDMDGEMEALDPGTLALGATRFRGVAKANAGGYSYGMTALNSLQVIGIGGGGAAPAAMPASPPSGAATRYLRYPAMPMATAAKMPMQASMRLQRRSGGPADGSGGSSGIARGYFARPAASRSPLSISGGAGLFDDYKGDLAGGGYTAAALSASTETIAKQSQAALKEAQDLAKKGDPAAARAKFAAAYLLDMASGGAAGTSAEAMAGIEKAGDALLAAWKKDLPGLDKTLQLVIRDKSVAEALEAVARAAGLKVSLVPGSAEDAAAILGVAEVRVTFLDLRGATAAQALDWILTPARMAWRLEKGAVVAATVRRGPAESAWVYDVSLAALPAEKEFENIKDHNKRIEAARKTADDFLAAVRKGAGARADAVCWYAPGQLLVIGDAALHAAVARLCADLADPKAKLEGTLGDLQKVTAQRAEDRKESAAKLLAAGEKVRVAQALAANSWKLLAASARGQLDLEALTELEVAWRQPATAEFLKGPHAVIVLRSFWAIAEASRALPKEEELAVAARSARQRCKEAADAALAALGKTPGDAGAYFRVLYAALAMRDDEAFAGKALPLLARSGKTPLGAWPAVAAALLEPAGKTDAKALRELVPELLGLADAARTAPFAQQGGLGDNDMIALAALACRRAGGEAWNGFRAESRNLLGARPLDGSVVVLVGSLARPNVLVAAAKP